MDVRFFTTFLEVSKTRHFSKAAENLYLTPAAVSARIKQLEEYFNTTLFTRVRNSIQLTPAGEKLIPYATDMVEKLKQARHALGDQDAQFMAFGVTPNARALIFEELIEHCRQLLPEAAITAETHCSEQLSRQLHERTIDFAFTTEPLKSADIESIELRSIALYLYTVNHASANDYAHITWSSKASASVQALNPAFKHYSIKSNNALDALEFVQAKGGTVMLPLSLGDKLENASVSEHAICSVMMYCVRLKERPQPFVDSIINCMRT
ncbi:LysR family transcriptional regulator [Glaciecola siphonariae]|uniref:LysR family transcriptional regulator n=1 Tax=Glaciecola siphonariae TaxID=521012 RepID=A0ABV9LWV3_9ALTE